VGKKTHILTCLQRKAKMFALKTTKNIPAIKKGRKGNSKYPFNKMGVDTDNSFEVTNEDDVKKVRSSVSVYMKNNPTKKFTVRKTGDDTWLVVRVK
jgi:hypothetical protein